MPDTLKFLNFDELIDRSLEDSGAIAELERRHRTEAAILVVDFTSMVKRTESAGIIYALARARSAFKAMQPAIQVHSGRVLKQVADTFFAVFPTPRQALFGALDGQIRLARFNHNRTGTFETHHDAIEAGIGLGFGPCLLIPQQDIFGAEVNRAFVLGEDTAEPGEVLVTTAFLKALSSLPSGVGSFEVSTDRAHDTGFHFFQVRDYRD